MQHRGMLTRLSPTSIGRWSTRRPKLAIAAWLGFVFAAVLVLSLTGTKQLDNGAVGETARGYQMLDAHQLGFGGHEYAFLHSDSLTAGDPPFRAAQDAAGASLRAALDVPVTARRSADGHSVLLVATATHEFSSKRLAQSIAAVQAAHPGVTASVGSTDNGSGSGDLARAEALSLPVTLLVLLVAFGALVAALVPVALAATAVIAAFGLLGPISHLFPLDDSVKTVVLLIGMAVGVDYALFYVVRSREERRRGLSTRAALERTSQTSGRSVLIAGTTVAIAMAGLFAIGSDVFNAIASATIVVVACTVAGSVTVLPALLQLLGPRIDRGRIPILSRRATGGSSRFWSGLVVRVLRRPVVAACLAGGLLVALAIPALTMRVDEPSNYALSGTGQSALVAQVTSTFPSTSAPAIVVASWPSARRQAAEHEAARLERLAAAAGIAHPPFQVSAAPDRDAGALALPLTGLGDNAASRDAVRLLRDRLIPSTLGRVAGVRTAVTGDAAQDVDFTAQMRHGLPFVVAFVLVLAFGLLLVTFRSIVVPLTAIALNLLSVAAAYGVLVLVFQHGWAQGVLGFHSSAAIVSWLPLFLFVVLFGLSMDYHVFILSRVREGVDAGLGNDDALRHGITRTAGVVTSAALVMVAVFSLFATGRALDLKQAGVGLAAAVLLDATVIRGVLLPATMKLLGERNWYLPRALDWLPRARAESAHRSSEPLTLAPAAD